ncbi:unnamed protein product [Gongylonema pulchrum]|uniref:Uncharacterized protein n=1 Tax=Gongylonema pulchrum TaxID=637853 RepID=A0A183CZY5_9BILA|nr:unnamed protein product [Gongylonema pulchrum]
MSDPRCRPNLIVRNSLQSQFGYGIEQVPKHTHCEDFTVIPKPHAGSLADALNRRISSLGIDSDDKSTFFDCSSADTNASDDDAEKVWDEALSDTVSVDGSVAGIVFPVNDA